MLGVLRFSAPCCFFECKSSSHSSLCDTDMNTWSFVIKGFWFYSADVKVGSPFLLAQGGELFADGGSHYQWLCCYGNLFQETCFINMMMLWFESVWQLTGRTLTPASPSSSGSRSRAPPCASVNTHINFKQEAVTSSLPVVSVRIRTSEQVLAW